MDLVNRQTIILALYEKRRVPVLEEINDARDGRNETNHQRR